MKICFWSTSFQADNQTLACYLAERPDVEVAAAIDRPEAFRGEAVWQLMPFRGRLLDRGSRKTRSALREFSPDIAVVDNHLPSFRIAPRVFVLWHGFGWRMDDISTMRAQLKKLVGDVTVSNPNFIWQAFGDTDREYTIAQRGIGAENVLALGSAYSDILRPESRLRERFDPARVAPHYNIDVAGRKTVLLGMTWHHGNLLGHWGDEEALLDQLLAHIRSRRANVIFRLHDRARYAKPYLRLLERVLGRYDHVHVKFKSESPDSLVDMLVSDVMISNYSSLANAFYYTGRPCVHIDPMDANAGDLVWRRFRRGRVEEERVEGPSAIWKLPPEEHGGLRASSFPELLSQIDRALEEPDCCRDIASRFVERHITRADGATCARMERLLKEWSA